jgi:quinol monooxygenase YgiN
MNIGTIIPKLLTIIFMLTLVTSCKQTRAIKTPEIVRLSKLVVDSAQLKSYKVFLKEGIEAAISTEPGVLTLYAMFERNNPTHLTIVEMYETEAAYRSHLKTPHFLKYKNGTLKMVKDLQLIDTDPLIPELKIK